MISALPLPGFDPLSFFSKLNAEEKAPVFIRHDEWITIAWNPSRIIRCQSNHDWAQLDAVLKSRAKKHKTDLPFIGGAIGCIPYDASVQDAGMLSRFQSLPPASVFYIFDQLIAWNGTTLFAVGDKKFRSQVLAIHNRTSASIVLPPLDFQPLITKARYVQSFKKAKRAIVDGEFYQINLAHQLQANADVDPKTLFCELAKTHASAHMSYLEVTDGLNRRLPMSALSFSPERFIQIRQQKILTSPIKGTSARDKTKKQDDRNRIALLASKKEKAELSMITDLLRNDIGQVSVSGSVKVAAARKLQKNASVWHTYSEIHGVLDQKFSHLQALRLCVPAGSVTGCPKKRACEYIDKLEWMPRGAYTGIVVSLSDHGITDSSIIIRTIIAQKNILSLSVGGGIVFDSQADSEWQETFDKAAPFLHHRQCEEVLLIDGMPTMITEKLRWSFDAANPHAYGVFEALRCENGNVLDLPAHLKRLKQSAEIIGMAFPHSLKEIGKQVRQAIQFLNGTSGRIKIVATEKNILVHCFPLFVSIKKYIQVMTVPLERKNASAKFLPYDDCYKAHQKANVNGCDEALLMDRNGYITEGAYSNIFWAKDGVLHTPSKKILRGIMREKIIRIARENNMHVRFSFPTTKDLLAADEIFLTNSIMGARPVSMIDGKPIRSKNRIFQRIIRSHI